MQALNNQQREVSGDDGCHSDLNRISLAPDDLQIACL